MAVELLGASDARLDWGDLAGVDALTTLSAAVTLKVASSVVGDFIFTKNGDQFVEQVFTIQLANTDEVGFLVQGQNAGSQKYLGRVTTGSPITANALLRILCRWDFPNLTCDCWINGSAAADASWQTGAAVTDVLNANAIPVQAGRCTNYPLDGVNGVYSELAIWDHWVPDWVASAYGKGFSAKVYRKGGLLYSPAITTAMLIDEWGGAAGTNTGGTTVAHPSVFYQGTRG
jgi:hypothetical protein